MPLIYDKQLNINTRLGVWETTENLDFFINELGLNKEELSKIDDMRHNRKTEWLASRYLCHLISGCTERVHLIKDGNGKPSLSHGGDNISISHSRNRAAVIISDLPVGIDIQSKEEKITRIQHKFISSEERVGLDQNKLIEAYHIFWGAKECMYKAYGKKELEFKKHMHLYPFKIFQDKLELLGWVRKDDVRQNYTIYTDIIDDYFLTYSILNNEMD